MIGYEGHLTNCDSSHKTKQTEHTVKHRESSFNIALKKSLFHFNSDKL